VTVQLTIGIPVFNGENFLEDCLASIWAQDVDGLEVLISDNASTDRTEEICRAAAADPRVRYVRQADNIGAGPNYQYVLHHAHGELFKWAAHDDVLGPKFLRRCCDALAAHPEAVLAFPRTRYIDERGEPLDDYDAELVWTHAREPVGRLRDLLVATTSSYLHLCYPVMGVMRRSAALSTRGIQSFQAADAAMLVELALLGDFIEVDEPLYLKRLHDDTSMRANSTPEDFETWYDPSNARRRALPTTRLAASHLNAVWRAPLSRSDTARGTAAVGRWFFGERRWRIVGSELRTAARSRLRGDRVATS
jgi:glycosyltransferase involved in cell wall biosynthesis